jgi:hypothetical protein
MPTGRAMQRIIRPTVLNCIMPVGFMGAVFASLGVWSIVSGIATRELLFYFALLVGFCALWCVKARRRITIVAEDGVAVRNTFGRLRRVSWSEISHSRILRATVRAPFTELMRGQPVRVEVFTSRFGRPALVIPVTAYRGKDVRFLLDRTDFKYESEHVG